MKQGQIIVLDLWNECGEKIKYSQMDLHKLKSVRLPALPYIWTISASCSPSLVFFFIFMHTLTE